ncbi:Golgin subfamily A member 7/ERF4 family-domain-containing protein [Hygrophoropsis aurantiaca]|uniref:Golgin subfamily A member 7/ERF4 family-domain-containing protein n=1 Tax=Hygrophoropsis aurantiaca TaxID=72124 RepID=A0ACB8A4A6_9AGAM|nr:Golgin subfamily A member 7/ERF4 family-domain-containing protein [Hygrophoropsis aurantiaca]
MPNAEHVELDEIRPSQKSIRIDELPPSPPLTRVGTNESATGSVRPISHDPEVTLAVEEVDVGDSWHPLENELSFSKDDDISIDESHSVSNDEKGIARPRNGRVDDLRLEFKAPSPQPWDLVDPPLDNNEHLISDNYSTLASRNFTTLQKNTRKRPLIPHSSYYFGPPASDAAYGSLPIGQIGVHHPREIVRIERDFAGGELIQFASIYPIELDGRITPTQFLETINSLNEILISAHSIRHSFFHNFLAVMTLQISSLLLSTHYEKEMRRLAQLIDDLNVQLYNPVGLNILWPRKVAFLFLEIEYYVSLDFHI